MIRYQIPKRQKRNHSSKTACLASLLALTASLLGATSLQAEDSIPDRLFSGNKAPILYPSAPMPPRDRLVVPPGESIYFPVRTDGQPYVLNVDRTVNLTSALNQFYYNPKWRGEVWTPFDQFDSIERATRLMGTWREYDEFSSLRVFNGFHKFFEKYSGFGP